MNFKNIFFNIQVYFIIWKIFISLIILCWNGENRDQVNQQTMSSFIRIFMNKEFFCSKLMMFVNFVIGCFTAFRIVFEIGRLTPSGNSKGLRGKQFYRRPQSHFIVLYCTLLYLNIIFIAMYDDTQQLMAWQLLEFSELQDIILEYFLY